MSNLETKVSKPQIMF